MASLMEATRTGPRGRVLVLGYGNPGRLDDGLGPATARAIAASGLPGVDVEEAYQLTVEDAALVAAYDTVIFVDAALEGPAPFAFRSLPPRTWDGGAFTTHTVEPDVILGLARDVFGGPARGWTLGVRGYRFRDFGETLSDGAAANLEAAVAFLRRWLTHQPTREAIPS